MRAARLALGLALGACFPDPEALVVARPSEGDAAAGAETDAAPDAPGVPDVAGVDCADFAAVWCARQRACKPASLEALVGSAEACPERMTLWCRHNLAEPPDTGWTPGTFRTCIRGLAALSCEDWRLTSEELKGPGCVVTGQRPLGAGCLSAAQCQSTVCRRFGDCGFCQERSLKEGPCTSDLECVPGLFCAGGKCKTPGAEGTACDAATPCHPVLRCAGSGRCVRRGAPGAACTEASHCDRESFSACNLTTRRCVQAVPADTWSDTRSDGGVDLCRDGRYPASDGRCLPRPDDGAACSYLGDAAPCRYPATCVTTSGPNGTCLLPRPFACGATRAPPPDGYPAGEDPWCPRPEAGAFCAETDPAFDGICVRPGFGCPQLSDCGTTVESCPDPSQSYDCQLGACGPRCEPLAPPAPACERCTRARCCGVKTACDADPTCHDGSTALRMCVTMYCSRYCR